MSTSLFEQLHKEQLISDLSLDKVRAEAKSRLFSIHWELRAILYLGILLLAGGLSILIYKNLDTIGHQAILTTIGLLCTSCFVYCERKKLPFSIGKVSSPDAFFDYVLLLGCLTLISLISYLQVQYTVFGTAYGLATFIPMVILFFSAYRFDHAGILSMAITNLAAWVGIVVAPLSILSANNFADAHFIFAALAIGTLLIAVALTSERRKIKAHFSFVYTNFGMNILFIACLAGMFHFENIYWAWLLPLVGITLYFYKQAVAQSSFYFILMISIYGYIAVSYVAIRILMNIFTDKYAPDLIYFIGSGALMGAFLIRANKKLKHNDSL